MPLMLEFGAVLLRRRVISCVIARVVAQSSKKHKPSVDVSERLAVTLLQMRRSTSAKKHRLAAAGVSCLLR